MAGLLPGVECARRRRLHRGGVGLLSDPPSMVVGDRLWRSSFYDLYMTSHEADSSSTAMRKEARGGYLTDDVKLGGVAREAKARLDMKLRSKVKSDLRRHSFGANGQSSMHAAMRTLQTEVFGMAEGSGSSSGGGQLGGSSRMMVKWPERMRWKSSEQEECAVCLERFRVGENLVNLSCGHRFHTRCLVPWLETNSRCPCCRTDVVSSSPLPPE